MIVVEVLRRSTSLAGQPEKGSGLEPMSPVHCTVRANQIQVRLSHDNVQSMDVKSAMQEYEELKDKQKEAVKAFASGKDVFVSLHTEYGKSLCLPVLFDALRGHQTSSSIKYPT